MEIDLLEVARLRLRNQRVTGEKLKTAADVVAWLGCVQSQEYSLAKWSLGMRVPDGSLHDTDVDAALAEGKILRTHILRPTWHFVAPADIRWIMRLTGPRILAGSAHRMRWLELDDDQVSRANEVMARALEGGKQLTRPELQAELARAGLHPDGQRIAYMVM
ncbi:MAG TPA: crosslink repair DNA glycosylase YcaQ family protein, partial [Candidatus Limnocylindrales bacterium]